MNQREKFGNVWAIWKTSGGKTKNLWVGKCSMNHKWKLQRTKTLNIKTPTFWIVKLLLKLRNELVSFVEFSKLYASSILQIYHCSETFNLLHRMSCRSLWSIFEIFVLNLLTILTRKVMKVSELGFLIFMKIYKKRS